MQTDRLEAFSDGVFAIAATLLVLAIRRPDANGHLVQNLLDLWPSYAAYATTFLLIGLIWANHHAMFVHIKTADRSLVFLNILLLANVSFLPFPTAILADALRTGHNQHVAAVLYGVTWTVGGVMFNAVWRYASHNRRLLAQQLTDDQARAISARGSRRPHSLRRRVTQRFDQRADRSHPVRRARHLLLAPHHDRTEHKSVS